MDPMQPLSKALDQVLLDWSGLHQERESTVFCFNLRPKLWTGILCNSLQNTINPELRILGFRQGYENCPLAILQIKSEVQERLVFEC